jgi:hypothetical protein
VVPVFADSAAIVQGGWLPPSIALPNATAFADRNFITNLVSGYENGKLKGQPNLRNNWMNINETPFSLDIIPYAIESNITEIPTRQLIEDQVNEVISKVQKSLPHVKITKYANIDHPDYVEKIIHHCRDIFLLRQNFFFEFSKKFRSKVSRDRVIDNWRNIVELAKLIGLMKNDLAVIIGLLVVSCKKRKLART